VTAPELYADDASLVGALSAGDQQAFAWLVDRYSGSLCRLARSFVPSEAVAEEVVQDTWTAVFTGIGGFERRSSLKTWIHSILVNVARTRGVKEHRTVPFASLQRELDADDPAVDPDRFQGPRDRAPGHWAAPPPRWEHQPEDRLVGDETLALVSDAINALPENQRRVITLRDVEGWSASEVCNALDLSETNVRVLLHRARAKVRRALEVSLGGDP
jgi:RNA polymerase sigma-70 factor (ECF subfamily)